MKKELTADDLIKMEIDEALKDYKIAQQAFDNADYNYIDIAMDLVTASKLKLDALYKRLKRMKEEDSL